MLDVRFRWQDLGCRLVTFVIPVAMISYRSLKERGRSDVITTSSGNLFFSSKCDEAITNLERDAERIVILPSGCCRAPPLILKSYRKIHHMQ